MPNRLLTKSKYLNGLQCRLLLWITINEPERIPAPDTAQQHIFDQGHLVGELAKNLYPDGIDVPQDDFIENIKLTKELLDRRVPLFEAGVLCGRIYSRIDILNPVNEDELDIIEVKSSTSIKDENLHDVSFQRLCCEKDGLKIRKCFLAYINNEYVKHGDINPAELFKIDDVTDAVISAGEGIEERIARMLEVIDSPACPEMGIGPYCKDPYSCPMIAECWDGMPEHSVFTLYYSGKKSYDLYNSGVLNIADIPAGYKLNEKQAVQHKCVSSNLPHIDKKAIKGFLQEFVYPLYYLDFETFSTAIPIFDNTSPYQQVPFQFSLHIQQKPGGKLRHYEYLAEGKQDPRPGLLAYLRELLGEEGSIVAYNMSFEKGILTALGEVYPEYAEWVNNITARFVDLMAPFKNFHYYHPEQKGSGSLKAVLPAVTGKGYDGMPIAEGTAATLAFLDITFNEVSAEEVARVRKDLLAYCKQDTEGMVWILEKLQIFC